MASAAVPNSVKAYQRNRRVLGHAVHPNALARLHELFPNARVRVKHDAEPVELPFGTQRMGKRYYQKPKHETRVTIALDGDDNPSHAIFATAICHHEDNFDRRKGVELAFRRALDTARSVYRGRRQDAAYENQGKTA